MAVHASALEAPVVGVCMGKQHNGLQALKWALEQLIPPPRSVYILHVVPPLLWIPNAMGGKLPIHEVNPELVKQFKEDRFLESKRLLGPYKKICDKRKVTSTFCYSENDSVEKEIVDQILKLGITTLVLESSPRNVICRAFTRTKSISAYVAAHAPDFCSVIVVHKGKLYSVKDAPQPSSLPCSSCSSIPEEKSISIDTRISIGDIFGDHFLAGGGFQIGERGMHAGAKDDQCSTSHVRLVQSASMDISRGSSEWLNTNDMGHQGITAKSFIIRNYPTLAPPQQPLWSPLHYSNAQPISEFESRASLTTDLGESFPDSQSQGHEFITPSRASLAGPSISPTTNGGILDTLLLYPECVVPSCNSTEIETPMSSCTPKGSSIQTSPMDSSIGSNEVVLAHKLELLQSQLTEAKQSAHMAQREDVRQENHIRIAEEAASAREMVAECERLRHEALNDSNIALQKASDYKKRWEEAVVTAAEEVRKHQETQNELETQKRMVDLANQQAQAQKEKCEAALTKLEEVTKKLEEECQLRKEAEERASQEASARRDAVLALQKQQQKYIEYTYQELQSATNNFHEKNKLGQGGYGAVYKGKLHHTTVAIKVLAREGLRGRAEFQKEVEVLSCICHPHMVTLLGACPEKGCIVYEYMANGSLEDRLNCRDGTPALPWYVRFRICLEVATALLFLHSRPQPIVHRDLKPGNILLDHNFVSNISDVGLAKLVETNATDSINETMIAGTLAYMDPDYQRMGVVSCESDVYSLGIVMLQLLTGQQAVGVVDMVEVAVENKELEGVLDKAAGEWPLREAEALACLGLQCAEPRRKKRANLETEVLPKLESLQSIAAASMAHVGPCSPGTVQMILNIV